MAEKNRKQFDFVVGLTIVGCSIVGAVAFIQSLISKFSGEHLAAGVFLLAAALSFGLLANAVLRE